MNTPAKIQDFVNGIPINFEVGKRTCRSPLQVLKNKEAHCMEGALLAADRLVAQRRTTYSFEFKDYG